MRFKDKTILASDITPRDIFENVKTLVIDGTWNLLDVGFYNKDTNSFNDLFYYFPFILAGTLYGFVFGLIPVVYVPSLNPNFSCNIEDGSI